MCLARSSPTVVTDDKSVIDFPMDGAPSVALTTTILARPFIEPDAARAPSTPSHLARRGSIAASYRLPKSLNLLNPSPAVRQVMGSKNARCDNALRDQAE